jgi:fumarate reductase flavoprotein subunit
MECDFDVVVVGGGGAGMAAAVTAADAGARVIIAESQSDLGGSTKISGGVFYAAGTSVQREAGISGDTPEAMFDYYMTLNQWRVEPALVRRLCQEAAPTLEWLIELGVMFPPENLYVSGVDGVARGHAPLGFGYAISAALEQAVIDRGIDVALRTRVDELLVEGGRVVGVSANGDAVRAGAVVLTTGGFGQSPDMLGRHYPEATAAGDWTWSISAPGCVGDGLELAEKAGAGITGHNRGLLLITPGFNRQLEVDPPGWLVCVNREGRRFGDETAAYAVMSGLFREQGGSAFAIFDEQARREAEPDSQYADAFAAGIVAVNFLPDVLAEMAEKGRVTRADTLAALAGKIGVPAAALCATVDAYNAGCDQGEDPWYFKDPQYLKPVRTPPFYAVEMRPAIVCLTATGVRIDASARALSISNTPIPGLLAAGETTGGVMGERYVGGGNSIANAIVFGRIAGREAADQAASLT